MSHRETKNAAASQGDGVVVVEILVGDSTEDFSLEKAVCSHGLFMMAPNYWDPRSRTLQRPLRLGDSETSFTVSVSQPDRSRQELRICVFGTRSVSPRQKQSLLDQVRRMLRLSEQENKRLKEFHKVHKEAKERGFGRVFRSPTLFEDMVKCILLCNCQWSRTLNMAQSLCDLQLELQLQSSSTPTSNGFSSRIQACELQQLAPKTPAGKESKNKSLLSRCSKKLVYDEVPLPNHSDMSVTANAETSQYSLHSDNPIPTPPSSDVNELLPKSDWGLVDDLLPLEGIGNFPSPHELAGLDVEFLAKRCNLGYRASRVINLAKGVVDGTIQLEELENACNVLNSSDYDKLFQKLRMIDGFGPFTCANVLMCMGFYHVIPTDSETIRHLKQVHSKITTIHTIQREVDAIYGKYAPFQFLAYWSEIWNFYEERFGSLSDMPQNSYKLITAANMRPKTNKKGCKRMKMSPEKD